MTWLSPGRWHARGRLAVPSLPPRRQDHQQQHDGEQDGVGDVLRRGRYVAEQLHDERSPGNPEQASGGRGQDVRAAPVTASRPPPHQQQPSDDATERDAGSSAAVTAARAVSMC